MAEIGKEGIVLHLNKAAKLKTGNIASKEFWISWDKIGESLLVDYCDVDSVEYRDELRGKI